MIRATSTLQPGDARVRDAARTVTLVRAERYRRRVMLRTDQGDDVLLDLAEATYLAHGAGLWDGEAGVVRVIAAEEALLKLTAPSQQALTRIAWHIGNRHTPAEVDREGAALYIQDDHVLAAMVRGLGGAAEAVMRPFEPEGGAYGGPGSLHASHHHGHHDDHGHGHGHGHTHSHSEDHGHGDSAKRTQDTGGHPHHG
ncbi:MAG: urease accessory protein UreE [Pseudomonadota bacterium]